MAALAWLVIPLIGACAAALWARWATRNRTTSGDGASLAGYERFRQAMQSSAPDGETPSSAEGEEDSPRGPLPGPVP